MLRLLNCPFYPPCHTNLFEPIPPDRIFNSDRREPVLGGGVGGGGGVIMAKLKSMTDYFKST